jgi:hypothetical protein
VIDPSLGEEIQMTVIATGFPQKRERKDEPRDFHNTIGDFGLPGVSSMEDAELPAFLRRNVRSLNVVGGRG